MNKKIVNGFIWRVLERFGAHGITFIVSLILARLLDPNTYGLVALVTVITSILQVFVESGLGTALIQKKDADDIDFSTVFYVNLATGIVLYLILFISASLIADFYKQSDLVLIIRVLGTVVIIAGAKNVQQAYVSRTLQFKKFFYATLVGTVGAGIIGVFLAYNGFGVWALVTQYVFNILLDTIMLWIIVPWRPKILFSVTRLKKLYSFGWKLLVSALLDQTWAQLRQLIIGVKYSARDLAYYNKGHEFPQYATAAINGSIDSVLLPIMSRRQDNKEAVRNMTRLAIKITSYLMWPAMLGLAACAEPIITILVTDKWLFAVPYLRIFCITYGFYPIHTANLNAIRALGRSDIFLKLEIIKKIVCFIIIIISMWFGVYIMALSTIIGSALSQMINAWPNKKLLNYSYIDQIKDILPAICLAVLMSAAVYPIQLIGLSDIVTLSIQVLLGISIYIVGSMMFHLESFEYLVKLIKSYVKK